MSIVTTAPPSLVFVIMMAYLLLNSSKAVLLRLVQFLNGCGFWFSILHSYSSWATWVYFDSIWWLLLEVHVYIIQQYFTYLLSRSCLSNNDIPLPPVYLHLFKFFQLRRSRFSIVARSITRQWLNEIYPPLDSSIWLKIKCILHLLILLNVMDYYFISQREVLELNSHRLSPYETNQVSQLSLNRFDI